MQIVCAPVRGLLGCLPRYCPHFFRLHFVHAPRRHVRVWHTRRPVLHPRVYEGATVLPTRLLGRSKFKRRPIDLHLDWLSPTAICELSFGSRPPEVQTSCPSEPSKTQVHESIQTPTSRGHLSWFWWLMVLSINVGGVFPVD